MTEKIDNQPDLIKVRRLTDWRVRLSVRTRPSQGRETGAIPVRATSSSLWFEAASAEFFSQHSGAAFFVFLPPPIVPSSANL